MKLKYFQEFLDEEEGASSSQANVVGDGKNVSTDTPTKMKDEPLKRKEKEGVDLDDEEEDIPKKENG